MEIDFKKKEIRAKHLSREEIFLIQTELKDWREWKFLVGTPEESFTQARKKYELGNPIKAGL